MANSVKFLFGDESTVGSVNKIAGQLLFSLNEDGTGQIYYDKSSTERIQMNQIGVLTYDNYSAFPSSGKDNTLYLDKNTNKIYYWDTNSYQEIQLGVSYDLPVASISAIGGIKAGGDITIDGNGIVSVNDDSHNHTINNIDDLQTVLDNKVNQSSLGVANGVATLDADGLIPSSQLPSYTGGGSGSGTDSGLLLGETSTTAYRGDRGKIAYDHATAKGVESAEGLYKITSNAQGHITKVTAVSKTDITELGVPAQDTTYSDFSGSTHGLVPQPSSPNNTTTSVLNAKGDWVDIKYTNVSGSTTYAELGILKVGDTEYKIYGNGASAGDSSSTPTVNAIVGLTASGDTITYTKNDGSTGSITIVDNDTTYSTATTSSAGLMSASDKVKLNNIATGANNYSLPTATSSTLGGVKIGSNISVSSGTISLDKSNVTSALGYTPPTTNTTYSNATTSSAGLMSASDKSKLDGITSGANNYSLPTATSSTLGGVKIGSNISVSSGTISLTQTNVVNALGYTPPTSDTNTWKANSSSSEGYVASGSGQYNKVWKTNSSGTPAWRDEVSYTDATTSSAGLMSASDKTTLNTISSNYVSKSNAITGLSISGKVITYTKGNGATGTLTTQDTNTTYTNATTSSAGLMSASDKSKLDNLSTYSVFSSGTNGLVPATSSSTASSDYVLGGGGSWIRPINTTLSTSTSTYPMLFTYNSGMTSDARTSGVHFNTNMYVKPSTGAIYANVFTGNGIRYSSSQPTGSYTGQLWLQPLT